VNYWAIGGRDCIRAWADIAFYTMHLSLCTLLLLFCSLVFAQNPPSVMMELIKEPCSEDIQKLCVLPEAANNIGRCLGENKDALSVKCKEGFQRAIQASQQAQSRGGGALGAFGGMNAFSPPISLLVLDSRVVQGEESTPRLVEHRLNFSMPVYRGETDIFSLSAALGHLEFQNPITLDTGLVVPTELQRLEVGGQYFRKLERQRAFNIRGSVGYVGDTLFKNSRDLTFSMNGMYSFPGSDKSMWALTVFLSNNSPIANFVPIPGFLYIYRTENFTGIFGLPIASVQWTPAFPWSLSMSIFGPTINMEAAYGSINTFQVFSGLQWTQQLYMLEQRVNDEDRLVLSEKRILVGLRTPLFEKINGELQIGNSFDRRVSYGEGVFDSDGGKRDLNSGAYLNLVLRAIL
jgi:hypothetical protein